MIDPDFLGYVMIGGSTIIAILISVISLMVLKSKTKKVKHCDHCGGEFHGCTITVVTGHDSAKTYCDPYCVEQGMKKDAETQS